MAVVIAGFHVAVGGVPDVACHVDREDGGRQGNATFTNDRPTRCRYPLSPENPVEVACAHGDGMDAFRQYKLAHFAFSLFKGPATPTAQRISGFLERM